MSPVFVNDVSVQIISNLICKFIYWCLSVLKEFFCWFFNTLLALLKKASFTLEDGDTT